MARLRLLLIVPTCDRDDVGEAWMGYQWVSRLAARHDVTLLTYHKRGRMPASQQLEGVRVIEWTEPPGLGRFERFNSLLKPAYPFFYVRARRWLRRALAAGETFHVVHQPLPEAMRCPCPAVGLGVPFIVGPVGGGLQTPPGFNDGETAPWFVALRGLDDLRRRRDPWLRRTYENAACVVGIAPYVRDSLKEQRIRRFEVMSDTAIEALPDAVPLRPQSDEVKLLFVGRLVRTKGVRDGIRALAQVETSQRVVFDIVGDGFDREACAKEAADLGLGDRVRFHGRLPRGEIDAFYRAADVFLFPSYREPGGNVPFEAMGFGLPLIVSNLGGPANIVDARFGIQVDTVTPDQYARDLAKAITSLVEDPERRAAMGVAARKRCAEIGLWDNRIEQIEALYSELVAPAPATATA